MRRLVVAALATLLVVGCGATTPSPSATTAPSRTPAATLVPNGSFVPDPALREAQSPDPSYDYGYVVQVTPQGFHPAELLSGCCLPVTWRNLTSETVSIVFDHQYVSSPPIPPGGTWAWTPPHIESITYHAGSGLNAGGVVQVQQTTDT